MKTLIPQLTKYMNELEFGEREKRVEIVEVAGQEILLIDGEPFLFKSEGQLFPTLVFERYISSAPYVVVDMGAVPHICNGADVMAPGVRAVSGSFLKGEIVIVLDETHKKPLAVGKALYDSEAMGKISSGAVVETLHYVGDKIWKAARSF